MWREAFNRVQEVELVKTMSSARVSGKGKTHIPASSLATVYARVNKRAIDTFTFTFSHLADAFIQSDLQLGVHKAINLEEANIQRKCQ